VEPIVAAAGDTFVVAWHATRSAGDGFDIRARRLCPDGHRLDEPVTINETPAQGAAALAGARDGRSAVAWNAPDGDDGGVYVRLLDADGRPDGAPARLNRHVTGRQALHAARATQRLAFLPDGSIACAWDGAGGTGDDSAVHVTVLSPTALASATSPPAPTAIRAAAPGAAGPHRPPTFEPIAPQLAPRTVVRSGGDLGFTGIFSTGWVPPDLHMAVGPEHLVLMTNGVIAFFTKDGVQTFQDRLEGSFGFWGELGTGSYVFDPEVVYDPVSERFFAMASEDSGAAYILLAVSDDADPNGDWTKHRLDISDVAGPNYDSPNMCVGAESVFFIGEAWLLGTTALFIYDKAPLLGPGPVPAPRSLIVPTIAQSIGVPSVAADDGLFYGIEHAESPASTTVRLLAFEDAPGGPQIVDTTLDVPAYGRPEQPPQAGTTVRLETFDARFWSVFVRDGSLWATHHVDGDRVLVRWYEIALNGWPESGTAPALVQSGQIDPGPGVRTFFSAITVDTFGNAHLVYARSAPNEFISMRTAMRYRSDPPGTFRPGVLHKANFSPYPNVRWGDYGMILPDPVDPKRVWAHHEFAQGSTWRTWVAAFTPDFASTDFNCDGIVDGPDLLALLDAWGDPCDPSCPTDVTGPGGEPDGFVDALDLLRLLAEWG
jgi:hypothetical protein